MPETQSVSHSKKCVLWFCCLLIIGEIGCFFLGIHGDYFSDKYKRHVLFQYHPEIGYVHNIQYAGVNSLGLMNPEIDIPKPSGTVRIAVLGNSIVGNTYGGPSIALRLETELRRRHPSMSFDIINAGIEGYTSRHMSQCLQHILLPLDLDAVIVVAGSNDIASRSPHERWTPEVLKHTHGCSRTQPFFFKTSISATLELFQPALDFAISSDNSIEVENQSRFHQSLVCFQENLFHMAKLGRQHRFAVIYSNMPCKITLDEKNRTLINEIRYGNATMKDFLAFDRTLETVARTTENPFLNNNFSVWDSKDPALLLDTCHPTAMGSIVMAQRMADAVEIALKEKF
jgi:lysophospholipase L1-like esterase